MFGGGFEERSVFLVGLYAVSSSSVQHLKSDHDRLIYDAGINDRRTYKWQATVCAPANLGLISVDKDPGVPQRSASSVARYGAVVCPADGLLVDELNGSIWTRLYTTTLADVHVLHFIVLPLSGAFSSSLPRPRHNSAYLVLDNALLEPRSTHRNLPWILTP